MIKIIVMSTFDQGDGPQRQVNMFEAESWTDMIKVLIEWHSEAPVLPDIITIDYK
jgi:hypothetical protein